jgi:AraC-like DNA-binding protein
MPCDETERPSGADTLMHVLEMRRAWLQNDPHAMLQALQRLAARCRYNSRELGRALGISARHLQRIFACNIGSTPQEWLSEQRLLAARDLLGGTCRVKEVAFSLGFRTVSQFSRDFKDRFGVTPTRRRCDAGLSPSRGRVLDSDAV